MSELTIEAKIHLATKVDNYHAWDNPQGRTYMCIDENDPVIPLEDYRPNDPDSPYAMKYLRGLWNGLNEKQKIKIPENFGGFNHPNDFIIEIVFNRGEELINSFLKVTGYTGKVCK